MLGFMVERIHVPPAGKLWSLVELYATTTDYLLTGAVSDAQPINNVRLLARFRAKGVA